MEQKNIDGLVSVVSALGWKPEMREVIGDDSGVFYQAFVASNPILAYTIAQQSGDADFIRAVSGRIVQNAVGGTNLEDSICEMYLTPTPAVQEAATTFDLSSFSVESLMDRYVLHNVPNYRGQVCTVNIFKKLLGDGANDTQDGWIKRTKDSEQKLASAPLYFAVLRVLHDYQDSPNVEEVREMVASDFKNNIVMTSTRVLYTHEGLDVVVHDAGYATQWQENADIVGLNGVINGESSFSAAMEALVGISDCQKIHDIGRLVTEKESYLWRMNKKPEKDIKRALVLDDDDGRFYIYAGDYLYYYWHARGWSVHTAPKNSTGNEGQ